MLARIQAKSGAVVLGLMALVLSAAVACGAENDRIDRNKVRELWRKQREGKTLTTDEKGYLDRAREARRKRRQNASASQPRRSDMTPRSSTGLVPLTDMTAEDEYRGQDGGLYGGGRNRPPKSHHTAAKKELAAIRPLDSKGNPSADGKIVLISIGMSNTSMEFQPFMELSTEEKSLSPHLVIVNGAHGGMDVTSWNDSRRKIRRKNITVWEHLDQQLAAGGVSGKQVQVAWLKQAKAGPARDGEFPLHANKFTEGLAKLAGRARQRYPNLRVMYLSSRIYAGYATSPLNPEPYAYETAFAVRWVIERQIAGEEELNYDPDRGKVVAPLLLWGPYLWADGLKGRKIDKLIYEREDLAEDGTHPSNPTGRQKVAKLLLKFFKADPLGKTWFLKRQ